MELSGITYLKRETQVHKALLVPMALKESKERMVLKENQDLKESKEKEDLKGIQEMKVQ
jgi:hypothetical protein